MTEEDLRARERLNNRMARIDAMPADLRACVHEFGLTIVDAFLQTGITKPKQIRHLVEVVRGGSVEIGKRRSGDRA